MKPLFAVLIALALLSMIACSRSRPTDGSAGAAPSELPQQDLSKLQGKWRIQSSIWNGAPESGVALSATVIFQDDQLIVVDRDGNRQVEKIRLMPDQTPKAIDCWSKDGRGQPTPGIYSLDGDVLTWCSSGGNHRVRPSFFASTPGSKQSLMVLRRSKE